jgi:hypothetical protein
MKILMVVCCAWWLGICSALSQSFGRLPIDGTEESLDKLVASGPCLVRTVLTHGNTGGGLSRYGGDHKDIRVNSMGELRDFAAEKCYNLFDLARYSANLAKSPVRVNVVVFTSALGYQGRVEIFRFDQTYGDLSPISKAFFQRMTYAPRYWILSIPGLRSCVVDTGGVNPLLFVGANGIILTNTIAATNRTRITLVTDSWQATYTQTGDLLREPRITLINGEVLVQGTPGADTFLESTEDFVTWSREVHLPWSSPSSSLTWQVVPQQKQFFRAYSQ